ncbi:MAG: hypothetical protein M3069_32305 [Chloroflexota bacterium]|nr:hypothetical protein [Chloroflexota bacterium]
MQEQPKVQQVIPAVDQRWAIFAQWHPPSPSVPRPTAETRQVRVQGWALADGVLYGVVVENNLGGGIRLAEKDPLFLGYMSASWNSSGTEPERQEWDRLMREADKRLRALDVQPGGA